MYMYSVQMLIHYPLLVHINLWIIFFPSLPVPVHSHGRRLSMDSTLLHQQPPSPGCAEGGGGDEERPSSTGDRKTSLTGEESDLEMFGMVKAEALLPLKEDLSEWLNKSIGELWWVGPFCSLLLYWKVV